MLVCHICDIKLVLIGGGWARWVLQFMIDILAMERVVFILSLSALVLEQ